VALDQSVARGPLAVFTHPFHAIRCQLDAIIALALCCGLRRAEIFRMDIDWMHRQRLCAVGDDTEPMSDWRSVHYTDSMRALVAPRCRMHAAIAPVNTPGSTCTLRQLCAADEP